MRTEPRTGCLRPRHRLERARRELPLGVRRAGDQEHRHRDRDERLEPPHADPGFLVIHTAIAHSRASRTSSISRIHCCVNRTVTAPRSTDAAIAQPYPANGSTSSALLSTSQAPSNCCVTTTCPGPEALPENRSPPPSSSVVSGAGDASSAV